ncbi:hypothetical protein Pint_30768 [Pistacia integerrima]|uniref:Uncharacterized protein n=1 Tax=Pistacia integerrima TaxID=434235 RepID=A0ACC0X0Z3_9ROSI|nr:hypothetical protein Pint_30768 [Pistacia integerrima]
MALFFQEAYSSILGQGKTDRKIEKAEEELKELKNELAAIQNLIKV